jgi:hypothetical protein
MNTNNSKLMPDNVRKNKESKSQNKPGIQTQNPNKSEIKSLQKEQKSTCACMK